MVHCATVLELEFYDSDMHQYITQIENLHILRLSSVNDDDAWNNLNTSLSSWSQMNTCLSVYVSFKVPSRPKFDQSKNWLKLTHDPSSWNVRHSLTFLFEFTYKKYSTVIRESYRIWTFEFQGLKITYYCNKSSSKWPEGWSAHVECIMLTQNYDLLLF